jgi:hypothetical protein
LELLIWGRTHICWVFKASGLVARVLIMLAALVFGSGGCRRVGRVAGSVASGRFFVPG